MITCFYNLYASDLQTISLIYILYTTDLHIYINNFLVLPPKISMMSRLRIGFHMFFYYINKMLIMMYPGCWTVAKTGDPLKYPNGVSAGYLSELG